MHSLELPRTTNTRAKELAAAAGLTLESYITSLVSLYAATPPAVTAAPPARDPMRVKLAVADEDWDAGRARARAEGTTLTEAIVNEIEAAS